MRHKKQAVEDMGMVWHDDRVVRSGFNAGAEIQSGSRTVSPECGEDSLLPPALHRELAPGEKSRLISIGSTSSLPDHTLVFGQGDEADALYTLLSGVIHIHLTLPDGRRQIVGFLYPGDLLGFAFGGTYVYGADSVTPVRLRRYPRADFDRLCERTPNLQRALLHVAANELTLAQDHMMILGRQSARERVASFFLRQAERTVSSGESGKRLWLPMRKLDIADYLGLTNETVSRTLSWFKQRGAIRSLSRTTFEILDSEILEEASSEV
jgi:CRP/FNR family transcriptional regulator